MTVECGDTHIGVGKEIEWDFSIDAGVLPMIRWATVESGLRYQGISELTTCTFLRHRDEGEERGRRKCVSEGGLYT